MKTAFVHDWLTTLAGAEKVLESMTEIFSGPIYTLVQNKKKLEGSSFENKEIISSFIQKFPFATEKYRNYLPFFPLAIEQFDLRSYDLILSSSHAVAKGVLTHPEQLHICYCHTPMRYAWDLYHQYLFEGSFHKGIKGKFVKFILHYLRMWDLSSAARVDHFVANSRFVAKRINKLYGKPADVIYPPVDTDFFQFYPKKETYYVTASRMVPYKKMDLIVEAFSNMPDKKLVVIGDGPEMSKVRQKAKSNIELVGYQSNDNLRELMQRAKAFIFAAVEDFGILPLEAQSCGTPVIAFGKGGVKETVIEGKTGIFYDEQTPLALQKAVERFEKMVFNPQVIRQHAELFHGARFKEQLKNYVLEKYNLFTST